MNEITNIMETLELKHLAPYLPFGVKAKTKDYEFIVAGAHDYTIFGDNENGELEEYYGDVKLILRPLSDLTEKHIKEIHSRCPNSPNWQELHKEWINEGGDLTETIIEYAVMEILLEWHFDVFRLIDKGLAIDINTLKQTS